MFFVHLETQCARRRIERLARIEKYVAQRKCRFAKTLAQHRAKSCLDEMAHLFLHFQTQTSAQYFVSITSPLHTPRPSQQQLIILLRDMETILRAHDEVDVHFRVSLLQIAANISAEKHMCTFLVQHTQLLTQLFKQPITTEEQCDATMLINNVYDDCGVEDRELLVLTLKAIARTNLFACEILYVKNNKLFWHWTEQTLEATMVLYAVLHPEPKTIDYCLQLLIKTLNIHNESHIKNMLDAFFETKKMAIINPFLVYLKPCVNANLFLSNKTITRAVITALRHTRKISHSVAMLLCDWALTDSRKCFDHLACNQESMLLLEQSVQSFEDNTQKQILADLFIFWFNMFSMCTAQTIHQHFFLFALRAYHGMPQFSKDAMQV